MQDNNKHQDRDREEMEGSWQTPGIVLRKARRDRGLSENEVCKELGLGIGALKALEADDFSRLPSEIYVRGYIRSYCALLDMPEQPVLDCYQRYCLELVEDGGEETGEEALRSTLPVWKKPLFWGAVVIVIAALVLLLVRGISTGAGASQLVQKPSAIPSELKPLQLQFSAVAWVEVTDSREDILLAEAGHPGQVVRLYGVPPFKLRIGEVDAVEIEYAGAVVEVTPEKSSATTELVVGQ